MTSAPSLTLHGLKACDTCRKALSELRAGGREVVFRDLRADPPTRLELERWIAAHGDALVNRRSTTWRGLPEDERDGGAIGLMLAHPTLIKRPVIEGAGVDLLGWTAATRAALGL